MMIDDLDQQISALQQLHKMKSNRNQLCFQPVKYACIEAMDDDKAIGKHVSM